MKLGLYLTLLGVDAEKATKLDVYFKKKKIFTKVDKATQDFIKEKLDLTFEKPPEVLEKDPELLTSSFDPSDWKAIQGNLSYAADLNEKEWSVIIRANCLMNGYRVILGPDNKPRKLEPSPYNAFKSRPRPLENYEISHHGDTQADSDSDDSDTDSSADNASDASDMDNAKDKRYQVRIPRFRVDDDSSVTVVETKNAFEKSCADSSFLEVTSQISASAAIYGVSVGANVGGGGGSSDTSDKASNKEDTKLVVNYKYPRVTVYLDPDSVEVTKECRDQIKTVRSPDTLRAFNEKYGFFFARRVQLGGRLSSSEAKSAEGTLTASDHATKMKIAASLSISHSFAQASVKSSYKHQDREVKETQKQDLSNNLAWEATGGDTLLCNNPAEWCATVGLYTNWRIVNQNNQLPLYQFLAACSKPDIGKKIIKRFELSAVGELSPEQESELSDDRKPPQDDDDGSVKKVRRQVFRLSDAQSKLYVGTADGSEEFAEYVKQNLLLPDSKFPDALSQIKESGISMKCSFAEPIKATEFIASTVFEEGEQEGLKFQENFFFRTKGHSSGLSVVSGQRGNIFIKGRGTLNSLMHFYKGSGTSFQLWDAETPGNKGYIHNRALVHLIALYDAVTHITKEGYVEMSRRKPGRSDPNLTFVYHAKEIVEEAEEEGR